MATLQGHVRRITFRNEDNHFTVAQVDVDKPSAEAPTGEVTVVGRFDSLAVGEWVELEGEWSLHETFGRQFQVSSYQKTPPATTRGILRYLGSGAITGIGPKLAERLVDKFGERTLEVMETEPDRLLEVEGIGAAKTREISKALQGEQQTREALVFLEGLGLAPGTAAKIHREYQGETIQTVRENPYCLADDIFGIGFRTADGVAREMGLALDSPQRAVAAVLYLLNQANAEGHLFLPRTALIEAAASMEIPAESVQVALEQLESRSEIVIDRDQGDEWCIYPSFLYRAEVEVAKRLWDRHHVTQRQALDVPDLFVADSAGIHPLIEKLGLSREQRRAVELALAPGGGLMVLTGGPGTGKTTTLRAIVEGLALTGRSYHLAAPTGRAAKRLSEATGQEARTVHRLLEYSGGAGFQFQRNQRNPLQGDAVIVDEASMIDLPLLFHLLRAVPEEAKLILVGDADQLPSVGPGNALGDLLRAADASVVKLTEVFRQAKESRIVVNAHRIQQGLGLQAGGEESDFFFVKEANAQKAMALICDLVSRRLPRYLGCDPRRDVQVLATVRRGALGVDGLNEALQQALNPAQPGAAQVVVGKHTLRPGDRVMQVRNNYDSMVFNGDIGTVRAVDPVKRQVEVHFPDRDDPGAVVYTSEEVNQLTLAYCTSVHKSQGSEYPAVVMPITWVMPTLMSRNLLYTAITRARRLVVLVGREDALWRYIKNDRSDRRHTLLAERMLAERAP